jgi:hypothetical protein
MTPPERWLAMSQRTISPLRPEGALKSMALPLACRDGRPLPAMMAPGRQVEMIPTGPNCASMRESRSRAAGERQVRDVPPARANATTPRRLTGLRRASPPRRPLRGVTTLAGAVRAACGVGVGILPVAFGRRAISVVGGKLDVVRPRVRAGCQRAQRKPDCHRGNSLHDYFSRCGCADFGWPEWLRPVAIAQQPLFPARDGAARNDRILRCLRIPVVTLSPYCLRSRRIT